MRAQGFPIHKQMADDRGHQAIRMFMRAELKENSSPSARELFLAGELRQSLLQGDLGSGIRRQPRGFVRQRTGSFAAYAHPGPIVLTAAPRHDGTSAAAHTKPTQQILA